MKRTMFFAAAAAVVLLAGCAKSGSAVSTAGTKKPVNFTFFTVDAIDDMVFDDPVAKMITKATGVTLTVDRPLGGDQQAIPLMIASGQYPDLIYAKGNLAMLIEAGAVIALDDLIENRGKYIKELYGDQLVRLRNSTQDPHIYTVGTYDVTSGIWKTDGTMQLQHAVLKELGYPRMKTLDDYEKAIKAYMAKYPAINGQKTIGLSLLIDTWQWYIGLSNPSCALLGHPDDGQWLVDQHTLEARYKFLHPDTKHFYQWLNRMNAEGILDPESFIQKEDIWKAKIAAGRVLGLTYPLWGYADSRTSLVNNNMQERTYAYLPIMLDESYQCVALKDYGFGGGWGIAISAACKDPERAFEFLDWMCSEEAQILINWGIEEVNYTVVDGKRIVPDEEQNRAKTDPDYEKKTGVGRWSYPFPMRGRGYIDSTGNFNTRDSPHRIKDQEYLDTEKETLAAYGAEMWTDLFPSTESLGGSKYGQAWQYTLPPGVNAVITEADNYMKNALATAVLGEPANFESQWRKIVQDLHRIGIEDAGMALTERIRDKIELWSGK
ncbi:MAG: ABC transporter substrate-binding protein [Treponema sp.]|jgi:putative aldouronate transport system substrate-binding protein|nr:ABC transporter substrate-binding protein [Treponema sp.]